MIQYWRAGLGLNNAAVLTVPRAALVSVVGCLVAKTILISVIRGLVTRTEARSAARIPSRGLVTGQSFCNRGKLQLWRREKRLISGSIAIAPPRKIFPEQETASMTKDPA